MEGKAREAKVMRWKGTLAEGSAMLRRVVAAVLAIACVALSFTQLGFIGIQFADGTAVYLVFLLVPVTLAAVLLGTLAGVAMGLFAGTVLYLHAALVPLDYYELAYVTLVTSVVAMAACGLMLGVLLALVLRRERAAWARVLLTALSCLGVSVVFSAGFAASTVAMTAAEMLARSGAGLDAGQLSGLQAQAAQLALSAGDAGFQAVGDAVLMALAAVIGTACAERGVAHAAGAGLRALFGAWLSAVMLAAFLVVATAAYGAITVGSLADAGEDMRSEVDYLLGQIERAAEYNGNVYEVIVEALGDSPEMLESAEEATEGGMLNSLLAGYSEEGDGLVAAFVGRYFIGSDAERLDEAATIEDCFDADVIAAIERSVRDGSLERVIYDGPSSESDLVDFKLSGVDGQFSSLVVWQIGYLSAVEHDGYTVVMIRPASMVFADRPAVMGWVSLASLVLLLVVFALVRRLLNRMVARRVDATNEALARVTGGDLDARVKPEGSREFVELADGLNGTVDALQGWIAEATSRMDAELAAAKAIQESALPQVFPPYPDIPKFDVYASMKAAREVGGDFYDFFLIGDSGSGEGKLGFVMADVSGKGVPAALFMMKAKTQIRDYLEAGMELGEAIENANRQLVDGNDAGMFVTAWVGVLDYATGHVEFANAGHNPPLLWQFESEGLGKWRWLTEKSGMPLGLFDGFPYETFSLDCKPGDTFLLYTDGVTEAMSASGELYGEDRLEALVRDAFELHPRELVTRVRHDVADYAQGAEQSDDITVLALEVGVPPEEKAILTVPADVAELPRVNEFIHAELDRLLCPMRAQNQLDIAVEELFVNVCRYAYEEMDADVPRGVRVTYAYSAEPPSITVEIIDGGVPYDPLAKPDAALADEYAGIADIPIGGLGILMAKRSVDEMRYERTDGSNVVTLVKRW